MSAAGAAPLEVGGLEVRIGRRTLVRGLTMQARGGEVWCVVGANGAGKSTFLETIVGLRGPHGGAIRIAGRPAHAWTPREAARLRGYLPQSPGEAFGASVLDVVLSGRHPHLSRWEWEGAAERRLAQAALEAVGLSGMGARAVATLSGGERQRAAIAALLVQETPLLLLDEPVAHLDLHHQVAILRHLGMLAREAGRAVVFSVHDVNLAARFATHALLFHGDGAVDAGPAERVLNESSLSAAMRCRIACVAAGAHRLFVAA